MPEPFQDRIETRFPSEPPYFDVEPTEVVPDGQEVELTRTEELTAYEPLKPWEKPLIGVFAVSIAYTTASGAAESFGSQTFERLQILNSFALGLVVGTALGLSGRIIELWDRSIKYMSSDINKADATDAHPADAGQQG